MVVVLLRCVRVDRLCLLYLQHGLVSELGGTHICPEAPGVLWIHGFNLHGPVPRHRHHWGSNVSLVRQNSLFLCAKERVNCRNGVTNTRCVTRDEIDLRGAENLPFDASYTFVGTPHALLEAPFHASAYFGPNKKYSEIITA